MQLLHSLTTIHSIIFKYIETWDAWEPKLKEVKDKVANVELSHSKAVRLKEDATTRLKEKKGELIREHSRAANMEAKLDHCEVLRWLAKNRTQANKERIRSVKERAKETEDRAKVVESQARATEEAVATIIAWAVEMYKDSDAFVSDATVATASIYVTGFNDYKAKVTKAYTGIDLHRIIPIGEMEEEEDNSTEEGEAIKEGAVGDSGADGGIDRVMATKAWRAKRESAPAKIF